MSSLNKTFFIAFEGGDGAGKTSQIKLLENILIKNNYSYIKTREPGGTRGSEQIRDFIMSNNFSTMVELLLFIAARYENIDSIINPNKGKVDFILCDRFLLSTLVYQGAMRNVPFDLINNLHKLINFNLYPDLTLLLDIDIDSSYQRLERRKLMGGVNNLASLEKTTEEDQSLDIRKIITSSALNKFDQESKEWHKKINFSFKEYKNFYKGKTAVINANLSLNEVHKQIIKSINNNLNLNLK